MACVVIGALITGLLSVVSGMPGEIHHVGFTVISRVSWGMKGAYFPVCLRVFTSIWWFGIQSYWGGQAVTLMLGALSPSFKHAPSAFPASANITHQDLVGVVLWYVAYVPLVVYFPPEKLQRPFIVSSAAFACTMIGLLAWSVPKAGGGGPLFALQNSPSTATGTGNSAVSYAMMLGITSILSSWGSGTIGQSDWVRYSHRRHYPLLSQLVAAPVMITCCALVGVVVTSASSKVLGLGQDELIWSPILLVGAIQDHYQDSPGARAASFFAGLGCTCAQLSINVLLNSVSTGMDMAGLWPRYINIKRGALILAALGLASNPWQILSSAATFLNVISGLGMFVAPMTGIMLCDYLVIRRRRISIPDLYSGEPSSKYWYRNGFHWRAIVAFVLGAWPFCPGFVMTLVNGGTSSADGWIKLFNISFLVALAMGFFLFLAICTISPPPHRLDGDDYLDDEQFCKSVKAVIVAESKDNSDVGSQVDVKADGIVLSHRIC